MLRNISLSVNLTVHVIPKVHATRQSWSEILTPESGNITLSAGVWCINEEIFAFKTQENLDYLIIQQIIMLSHYNIGTNLWLSYYLNCYHILCVNFQSESQECKCNHQNDGCWSSFCLTISMLVYSEIQFLW